MSCLAIVCAHSAYSFLLFAAYVVLGVECDKRNDLHYVLSALLDAWGVYLRLSH